VNEIGYWFRDSQLQCHALHSPIYNDDCWGRTGPGSVVTLTERSKPKRMESVDEVKRALEVAERIPYKYLIQHLGVSGEEWDEFKVEAAFTALEELRVFAKNRGVEILLENIPNRLSTPERLLTFNELTHLDMYFCLDTGHANLGDGVGPAFQLMKDRIKSTHVHDNDRQADSHLFPLLDEHGTVDWAETMGLLRTRQSQYPLLLELKDSPRFPNPIEAVREIFEKLENV